VKILNG
jgi:hypothetical protein